MARRERGGDEVAQREMHGALLVVVNAHEYTARHRLPLIQAFQRAGLHVCCAAPAGSGAMRLLQEHGLVCHRLPMSRRGMNPFQEIVTIIALTRLYARLAPQTVYHATIKPVLYGSLAARLAGRPLVLNAITGLGYLFTDESLKARFARALVLVLYRLALRGRDTLVIFQNRDDQEYLSRAVGIASSRSILVPGSGVDMEEFIPQTSPPAERIVLFVGRMLRDKGVAVFVKAAQIVREAHDDVRFVLVGDTDPGNPSSLEESEIRTWEAAGAVEWWGARTDMRSVYARSSVVVLPSLREGLPKVLIEAAACGLPVVASDVPGCRDAVVDGETGFLVPPRHAAEFARCIGMLLTDGSLSARMGARGRERAQILFSTEAVTGKTLAALCTLESERNARLGASATRR